MASYLSAYQTAVLHEMGICVWQHQKDRKVVNNTAPDVSVVAENPSQKNPTTALDSSATSKISARDHIARMRSSLGKPASNDEANKTDVKQPTATPPQKETIDFNALGKVGEDIKVAVNQYLNDDVADWDCIYGDEIAISPGRLTLPKRTDGLTPSDKKTLWKVIVALEIKK